MPDQGAAPTTWRLGDAIECARTSGPHAVVDEMIVRRADRPAPNAWTTVVDGAALHARAEELASAPPGALFGVPIAIKDNIDVAGLPTTAAVPEYTYDPAASAPAVQQLLAAGVVVAGKTNMDQF